MPICAATPYDRSDVTARGLANAYARTLGTVFTQESKPYEVEILVAEVGEPDVDQDQIYRLTYDGSVADEQGFHRHGWCRRADHPLVYRSGGGPGMNPG